MFSVLSYVRGKQISGDLLVLSGSIRDLCQHWIESQVLLFLETPFAYLSTLRFSFSVIEARKRKEGLFVIKKGLEIFSRFWMFEVEERWVCCGC